MKKQILLVHQPSPLLGQLPFLRRGFYSTSVSPESYVDALNSDIARNNLPWSVMLGNTDSDGGELNNKGADAIICTSGLRFLFIRNGFDKRRVIHLGGFEYIKLDMRKVLSQL